MLLEQHQPTNKGIDMELFESLVNIAESAGYIVVAPVATAVAAPVVGVVADAAEEAVASVNDLTK